MSKKNINFNILNQCDFQRFYIILHHILCTDPIGPQILHFEVIIVTNSS